MKRLTKHQTDDNRVFTLVVEQFYFLAWAGLMVAVSVITHGLRATTGLLVLYVAYLLHDRHADKYNNKSIRHSFRLRK